MSWDPVAIAPGTDASFFESALCEVYHSLMLKVSDMSPAEMHALLQRESFGHLGCARDGRPYVVPMHYAYDGKDLYFFTTQGMKTQFIEANPQVCLQIEEVTDSTHWRSVMVIGRANELTTSDEMQRAMKLITERNPSLTPAISATQLDSLGRAVDIALYRITPEIIDGRQTVS
jgi:nitroimidazol reductase NimA-like FMN-containing flavoprotein (pyridoxamine 5'-phosphate oxidase superfamily)